MCVCTFVHICAHLCTCVHTCAHLCTNVHMCVCTCVHICAHVCTFVHMCVCVLVLEGWRIGDSIYVHAYVDRGQRPRRILNFSANMLNNYRDQRPNFFVGTYDQARMPILISLRDSRRESAVRGVCTPQCENRRKCGYQGLRARGPIRNPGDSPLAAGGFHS